MGVAFCWVQEEIHELLLSFAEAGATVVRLKGGDPLVSLKFDSSQRIASGWSYLCVFD